MSAPNFHDYFAAANAQEGPTERAKTFIGCLEHSYLEGFTRSCPLS